MVPRYILGQRTATFINGLANLSYKEPRNLPDYIILDNCALLNIIPVDILLTKTFPVFVFCLVVRSNSWGSSSFFVILNVVPEILFQTRVFLINYWLV